MKHVKSNTVTDLIVEANKNQSKTVKVVFKKINLSDFPKSTHHLISINSIVGTQKTELFDVIHECTDIIELKHDVKNQVEKMYFI